AEDGIRDSSVTGVQTCALPIYPTMPSVLRRIVELDKQGRTGKWARPPGRDVWRKTLGIVGLGRIGKGVAQRASGFEMQVLAYERSEERRVGKSVDCGGGGEMK